MSARRRHPPANLAAERALLGACLLTPTAITAAVDLVGPDAFYRPAHGHIYEAIITLYEHGVTVDPVTVAAELDRAGLLEAIGDPSELTSIQADTPATGSAARYATLIAETADRRRLIGLAAEMLDRAYTPDVDLGDIVAMAAGTFASLNGHAADQSTLARLSAIEVESVSWLWSGYLPAGKLVILDGDPGLGKSTISTDLAARVSTGSSMPDGARLEAPAGVVLMSAEDGVADTILPRLLAAGGDPHQVHVLTGIRTRHGDRLPLLPLDIDRLGHAIDTTGARLVVIDVLAAYLDAKVNSYRDQDVRLALHPLSVMAARTGATVLILRHLNKNAGSQAIYRGGGSIGIAGAARAVLMVGVDPGDDTRRILAVVKSNLAAVPTSLAYRLVPDELYGCGRIAWEGAVAQRADDLLVAVDREEWSAASDAERFLLDLLDDGPVASTEVFNAARDNGIAKRTLERAKAKLNIWGAPDGFRGPWQWNLPTSTVRHSSPSPDMADSGGLCGSDADRDPPPLDPDELF